MISATRTAALTRAVFFLALIAFVCGGWSVASAGQSFTIQADGNIDGSINPSGTISVPQGENITFEMTPDACFEVSAVLVDGNDVGPVTSYQFQNVQSNHTISAQFQRISYEINATSTVGGTISPSGSVLVYCDDSQQFDIQPNACFTIADVKVDGVSQGVITSYTFTNVQTNHSISVQFTASPNLTISASAGSGGTISPSGEVSVNCGDDQTFSFSPDGCHYIADVVVDGNSVTPASSYTFQNVTTNHSIDVTFGVLSQTISTSTSGGGSISPSGAVAVNCGSDQTFTITPNTCRQIVDVQVDGNSVGAVSSYTFSNVTEDHDIAATFTSVPSVITIAPLTLPNGTQGGSYSQQLTASGGVASYTYQVTGGTTPPGLTLSSAGLLSGTTTTSGAFSFTVTATDATGCTGSQAYTVTVDPVVGITVSVGDYTKNEGDSGYTYFYFDVTLSGPSASTVKVNYATQGITATSGNYDYVSTNGTLTFSPGVTQQTAIVKVIGDTKFEPDETFRLKLTSATGATILDGEGIGTILNDDTQPSSLSINDVSKLEGNSGTRTMEFTVTLTPASTKTVTVNYATHGVTATITNNDYIGTSGKLTIQAGKTSAKLYVTIKGDRKVEKDETFEMRLYGATNATISDGTGIGTILNDDGSNVSGEPVADDAAAADAPDVDFILGFPAPNPSKGAFRIDFTLPREAAVHLAVLDIQGRELSRIADGDFPEGQHQVEWNGRTVRGTAPAGVYFVHGQLADRTFTRRIVITP